MTVHKFLVITEKANGNYSSYSPDLPGCVATGGTREESEQAMYEAIQFHIDGLLADDLPIPEPDSFAVYMAVP